MTPARLEPCRHTRDSPTRQQTNYRDPTRPLCYRRYAAASGSILPPPRSCSKRGRRHRRSCCPSSCTEQAAARAAGPIQTHPEAPAPAAAGPTTVASLTPAAAAAAASKSREEALPAAANDRQWHVPATTQQGVVMGRPTERRKGAGVACGRPCLLKTDAAASTTSLRPARSRRARSRGAAIDLPQT